MGPGAPMPWQALEAGHSRPLELDVDVPSTPESLLLGGEEFGILLVETSLADGLVTARRIHEALHHTPMKRDTGEVLTVTASMGLSEVTTEDTSLDSLISRADMALYKAKDLGRDRIEVNT